VDIIARLDRVTFVGSNPERYIAGLAPGDVFLVYQKRFRVKSEGLT